jgi:hypothetical protein
VLVGDSIRVGFQALPIGHHDAALEAEEVFALVEVEVFAVELGQDRVRVGAREAHELSLLELALRPDEPYVHHGVRARDRLLRVSYSVLVATVRVGVRFQVRVR